MKFLIQAQINIELEAADLAEARKVGEEKLKTIEQLGAKTIEAKVVDIGTGFVLK